jgi:membrane-associated protease RseP (regulator of RpoE activity)
MKITRIVLTTIVLAAAAAPAQAQRDVGVTQARRGWLGFSYEDAATRGARARIVVREVVEGSPAQRAGLQVGDTLLTINDLQATESLIASLALEPGEVVHLAVRRGGRDLRFDLTAAERPAQYTNRIVIVEPDSVRARMRIFIDSMAMHLDSLDLPRIYIERRGRDTADFRFRVLPRDSFVVFGDSLPRAFRFRMDTVRVRVDSVLQRMMPRFERLGVFGDTTFRWGRDSVWRAFPESFYVQLDSLPGREFRWSGVATLGMRAIAGAELTGLSPGLAQLVGVDEGVLVLRVPAGTPAERSGIREADVIVRANGRDVTTVAELRSAIARVPRNDAVSLEIVRDRQRVTLDLRRE